MCRPRAIPTGELKHGPNALVGERVPLVALATVDRHVDDSVLRYEKTSAVARRHEEARSTRDCDRECWRPRCFVAGPDCVFVEPASEHLLPIPEVIPLQFSATPWRWNVASMWTGREIFPRP